MGQQFSSLTNPLPNLFDSMRKIQTGSNSSNVFKISCSLLPCFTTSTVFKFWAKQRSLFCWQDFWEEDLRDFVVVVVYIVPTK